MSALNKLKAYFGMVPAEDEYDFDDDYRRGYSDEYDARGAHDGRRSDLYDERYPDSRYADHGERSRGTRTRYPVLDEFDDPVPAAPVRSAGTRRPVPASEPATHGSLAMRSEAVTRLHAASEQSAQTVRDPLSRIITLHPTSYTEARDIGEAYRDGAPVIINLTEMENADAKRVVDFAAGLAFALRGSMDRVTTKVFLLSPPNVDVSAEDRQRIAENGFFLRKH